MDNPTTPGQVTPDKANQPPTTPEPKPVNPADMEVEVGGQKMKVADLTRSYDELRAKFTQTSQVKSDLEKQLAEAKAAKTGEKSVVDTLIERLQGTQPTVPTDPMANPSTRKEYLRKLATEKSAEEMLDVLVAYNETRDATVKAELEKKYGDQFEKLQKTVDDMKQAQETKENLAAGASLAARIHAAVPEYVNERPAGGKANSFAKSLDGIFTSEEPEEWLGNRKPSEVDPVEVAKAWKVHLDFEAKKRLDAEAERITRLRNGTITEPGEASKPWVVPDEVKNITDPQKALEAARKLADEQFNALHPELKRGAGLGPR